MKAFKAYLKKEYPHLNDGDAMFAWDIWRAAMNCVLDKCHHHQSQDVIDFIHKELEEE